MSSNSSILREIAWDPFLESPANFSGQESHSKISNPLTITELLNSHIFNVNIQEVSGVYFSGFRYRCTKNGQGLSKNKPQAWVVQKADNSVTRKNPYNKEWRGLFS